MTWWAPQTVARRLGLSTSRVVQLDREGRLRAQRDSGGRRLYDPKDVEAFAAERETTMKAAAERRGSSAA